jgi:hypothetical protein
MRPLALLASTLAIFAACSSQQVQKAATCSDPCCGGVPSRLDCSESPDVTCPVGGDPCAAEAFGCSSGMFFMQPQASLPATCASDSGLDGTVETVDAAPIEAASDAPSEATADAAPEGAASDAAPEAATPAGTDAAADAAGDAASDAP